jgi:hypothetical protein
MKYLSGGAHPHMFMTLTGVRALPLFTKVKIHQIELLLLSCSNQPNNVTTDTE